MNDNVWNEIRRLNFEDLLWIIFIVTSILNIIGNDYQKRYVVSNNENYENKANDIYENMASNIYVFILIIVLFIYLYFFNRNYKMYESKMGSATRVDLIKVMGSVFFIIGTLCLLYFQINSKNNFIGGPAI